MNIKKNVLAICTVLSPLVASAQTNNPGLPLANYTPGIYHGWKTSNDSNNPCKGLAIFTCAVIISSGSGNQWTTDPNGDLSSTPQTTSATNTEPTITWYVPSKTSDEEFATIKAKEFQYRNLRVVRGIPGEDKHAAIVDDSDND